MKPFKKVVPEKSKLKNIRIVLVDKSEEKGVLLLKLLEIFSFVKLAKNGIYDINDHSILVPLELFELQSFLRDYPDSVVIIIENNETLTRSKRFANNSNVYRFLNDDFMQCFADVASTISTEMKKILAAIVGLAGTGKGFISTEVAAAQGGEVVDTGIFFRAIVWYFAIHKNIAPNDPRLPQLLKEYHDNFNIKDYSEETVKILRSKTVGDIIPQWSSNIYVREVAFWLQMKAVHGSTKNFVAIDGRDSFQWFRKGSFGFIITCDLEICTQRRLKQYLEQGLDCTYEEVRTELITRNKGDSPRMDRSNAMASPGWVNVLNNSTDNRFSCISGINNKIEPLKIKWESELENLAFIR